MDTNTILAVGHIIGVALGVGGATISDFLFLRSIKDGKLEKKEFDFLKVISNIVWLGLIILFFSGFGFLLQYRIEFPEAGLLYNPKLWAKLLIVLIIFLNGLVMHRFVFPALEASLGKPLASSKFAKRARIIFTTGAISIVSWYSALILGSWRSLDFATSFGIIFTVYLAVLVVAIIVANIMGKIIINKSK